MGVGTIGSLDFSLGRWVPGVGENYYKLLNYPRPTNGIFDAITVICNTFADNGSDAM